ncbi:MAG: hypothetical protein ACKPJK_27965 [Microcystis panniformis]
MSEEKPPDDLHKFVKKPADRHYFSKVNQGSCKKKDNTVIEPRVNVNADMKAIRAGRATYGKETTVTPDGKTCTTHHTYTVNGRTYGVHADKTDKKTYGTTFPIRGDGFHPLNRGGYQALSVYNKHGDTPQAEKALNGQRNSFLKSKDPVMQSIFTRDQVSGRKVWETVKRKQQSQMQSQMQPTSKNAAMAGFSKLAKAKEAAAKNKSQPSQTSNQSQSQSKVAKDKETQQKNAQAPKPPTQSPKRTR